MQRIYDSYGVDFRARLGAGAQVFGGFGFEKQLEVSCTAPDDPNTLRFCDDRENDLPFRKQFKLSGSYPIMWGITLSGSFQSVQGNTSLRGVTTALTPASAAADTMAITRGTTRYPANCPAPCPAGAIILPATFQPATFTLYLEDQDKTYTDRINQLDLKIQKTFRFGRMSVAPVFEAFNVINSDAIVSYVTTSVLNTAYQRPNSILQGRILGLGATVRW